MGADKAAVIREFERARGLAPESWSTAINLLWFYGKAERPKDAKALADALEAGKREEFVDSFLAHQLSHDGEFKRALAILDKTPAPPDTPLRIELRVEKMRAKLGLGDLAGILELGLEGLGNCEHDEAKLHLLFHIDERAGQLPKEAFALIDPAAAEAGLKKAIAEKPGEVGYVIGLGAFYSRLGRPKDELATLVKGLDTHAKSEEYRHHFARFAWRILAGAKDPAIP